MAYVQPNTANQKAATIVIVSALHAAAFLAILNGLGVSFVAADDPIVIKGTNHPLPTPTPTPEPTASQTQTQTGDSRTHVPPPKGGDSPTPLSTGSTFTDTGAGGGALGGTGDGLDIPDPTPDPTPRFTPRSPRARGDTSRWVTTDDYPRREAELGHEGLTGVRLTIGGNGQVTGCAVTATSGWPNLDRATCTWLTRRARFEPATDSDGAATAGQYSTSVRWQLPDD